MSAISPQEVVLHLMRPVMWELHAGGLDRMDFSLTPPTREAYRVPTLDTVVELERWTSPSGVLSCRILRKIGSDALDIHLWETMKASAFPGIDQDEWANDLHQDPPGAVPESVWTDTCSILVGLEPFDGASCLRLTMTGPWLSHVNQFRGDAPVPDGLPSPILWFMEPRLQTVVADRLLDPFRPEAGRQRPYWSHPYGDARTSIGPAEFARSLPEPLATAILAAAEHERDEQGYPPLEWRSHVDLWIAPLPRSPVTDGPAWSTSFDASSSLAQEAWAALRREDVAEATRLYREASHHAIAAYDALPPGKPRTRGVVAVHLVAVLEKAGEKGKAAQWAERLLTDPEMPAWVARDLGSDSTEGDRR